MGDVEPGPAASLLVLGRGRGGGGGGRLGEDGDAAAAGAGGEVGGVAVDGGEERDNGSVQRAFRRLVGVGAAEGRERRRLPLLKLHFRRLSLSLSLYKLYRPRSNLNRSYRTAVINGPVQSGHPPEPVLPNRLKAGLQGNGFKEPTVTCSFSKSMSRIGPFYPENWNLDSIRSIPR